MQVNVAENLRCAVYDVGLTPSAMNIYKAQGSVQYSAIVLGTPATPQTFRFSGLSPASEYVAWCATISNARSEPLQVSTARFTSDPKLMPGSQTRTGFSITTAISTKEHLRCIVMHPGVTPTGADVYRGQNAQSAPEPVEAQRNTNVFFSFNGLTGAPRWRVWCATKGGALSNFLDVTVIGFSQDPTIIPGSMTPSSFSIQTVVSGADRVNCGLYAPGSQVTPDMVLRGDNAFQSAGDIPTSGATPVRFSFNQLVAGTQFEVYCATLSGVLSNKLDVVVNGGFASITPLLQPSATTFSVAVVVAQASQVGCVVVREGERPSSSQIMQGNTIGDQKAAATAASQFLAAGVPGTFNFAQLQSAIAYEVICSTNMIVSSPLPFTTSGAHTGNPTLDPITDVVAYTGTTISNVQLTGLSNGMDGTGTGLTFRVYSTNQQITGTPVVYHSSPDRQATLTIRPLGRIGTAQITVTVISRTGTSSSQTFTYSVSSSGSPSIPGVVVQGCASYAVCDQCTANGCSWNRNLGLCTTTCSDSVCAPLNYQCGLSPSSSTCQYTQWTTWSSCSAGCSGGTQTRSRTLISGVGCQQQEVQTQICTSRSCLQPTIDPVNNLYFQAVLTSVFCSHTLPSTSFQFTFHFRRAAWVVLLISLSHCTHRPLLL